MSDEKRIRVKETYIVRLLCECGHEMSPTGTMLTSHPPRYVYECGMCGKRAEPTRTYPYFEYEFEGDAP